ncbi:MAG: ribosome maturation factor RimM [Synergistaceae bacterium]|jgi:16S rRNA processing protein RimM|nr:ribosome maturation factor RimM [Synergistaceae bacterium]
MWTSSRKNNPDEGEGDNLENAQEATDKITIGYVSSAHGVKGEVKVVPLTDFPERFQKMDTLDLYAGGVFVRTLRVTRMRKDASKNEFIVASDISDRDEARKCAGMSILIDRQDRVPLPEGSFWVDDLLGLSVENEKGEVLGVVANLLSSGGNEIYEIEDEKGKFHYIPAVENFVKNIDLDAGKIVVELIEGLW